MGNEQIDKAFQEFFNEMHTDELCKKLTRDPSLGIIEQMRIWRAHMQDLYKDQKRLVEGRERELYARMVTELLCDDLPPKEKHCYQEGLSLGISLMSRVVRGGA